MIPVVPPVRSSADLSATPASGQSGFAAAETEAQLFVDIYNNFLLSDSNTTSALSAPGASTNSLLQQLLNSQSASKTSNGKPLTDSLGAIGIGFQQPSTLNATGQLTLDTTKLESAFSADPSGTQAAVTQAVQSIGQLSAKFSSTFVPDFSTSSSGSSLFGGQSTPGDFLSAFNTSSGTPSIWDTLGQSPQLAAAQILGTFNTSGAKSSSLASIFAQGGSAAADFLSAFDPSSATPSIWDTLGQNPQLIAAQVLGTLPALPTTQKK
jgi:flagellar capping protein FliD